MRVLREPKVYLVYHSEAQEGLLDYFQGTGRVWNTVHSEEETGDKERMKALATEEFQKMLPQWVSQYPGDSAPEFGGRLCYDSFRGPGAIGKSGRKSNEEYLNHIKLVGHGSVGEHCVATFLITGASRGFTHEAVRHRAGFAYSQSSTRYCDGEQLDVALPHLLLSMESLAPDEASKQKVQVAIEEFAGAYQEQRDIYSKCFKTIYSLAEEILKPQYEGKGDKTLLRKMVRSCARSLLPIGTVAPIVVSGNYRAWRHWMTMRGTEAAELEIRAVTVQVFDHLQSKGPNFFGDWEKFSLRDGTQALRSSIAKV